MVLKTIGVFDIFVEVLLVTRNDDLGLGSIDTSKPTEISLVYLELCSHHFMKKLKNQLDVEKLREVHTQTIY